MATGLAAEFDCELTVLGSVKVRLSGPEDAATAQTEAESAAARMKAGKGERTFIAD